MAKRRERRVAAGSDRSQNRVEASTRRDQAVDSTDSHANQDRKLITIFVIFLVVFPAVSVIVYRTRYAPRKDSTFPHVDRRGLVKTNVNYQEILTVRTDNNKVSENKSRRHYTYPVLGYITPWNSRGYELAKSFNSKFTHLSPVWYDLKSQRTKLFLEGRHNADTGWISELRMKGGAKVLPRVVLEAFPTELLKKKKQRNNAIDLIITECKEMEYDGIVLESWSRWAAYGILQDPGMRNMALQFVKQIGQALHAVSLERNSNQHLELVYVIGPPHSEKLQEHDFGPEDLKSLGDAVDGFSLMTYDFSGPQNPGPNAPLKWIHSTLQLLLGTTTSGARSLAHKIFVGINFYGNDFVISEGLGGGPITGREYLSLLEQHRPSLQWEKNSAEHFFVYSENQHVKHAVFYPSLMSMSMRLEEARLWGAGISIWEIGQVLNTGFAGALTYEEALQQSVSASTSGGSSDFDASGILDSVISFGVENPAVIIGGATILALPLVLSQVLSNPKPWGLESAKTAYAKLGDDANAQLLDIRAPVELRQVGSPDIRGLKKKPVPVVYKGEDKPGFLKKLALKFKEPENTTLFILDKFDGNSELVAKLVTANGFKAAYAIKDGAEGTRGWMDSDALSVSLGIAAATGLGLLVFSEVETILQLIGSAALVQFVGKKLLFAEDRKQTLQQVDEFLSTEVAPKDLLDEIKQIGKALLPSSVTSKVLPAPAEASPTATTDNTVQKAEALPEFNAAKVEATAEPLPQVNSAPKAEVNAESVPGLPRRLSPYPFVIIIISTLLILLFWVYFKCLKFEIDELLMKWPTSPCLLLMACGQLSLAPLSCTRVQGNELPK
ncbi:hypothetical protein F0562_014999 [Nyssa sinensis]|uniref:Chitinase domain-containing protein 1 n=1 Tax=Nyssa sinensis TaxID=561372 RepID=A0A5J4ZRS2_9ASTE|nr:hypothetical protein F0562_014999 [Nyssa sinensis]